jgi:hypothetical protein
VTYGDPLGLYVDTTSFSDDVFCYAQQLEVRQRMMQRLPQLIWGQVRSAFYSFVEFMLSDFLPSVGQIALGFTPIGILLDIYDMAIAIKDFIKKPSWGTSVGIAIASIGFIPIIGDIGKGIKGGLKSASKLMLFRPGSRKLEKELIVPARRRAMQRIAREYAEIAGLDIAGIKIKIVKGNRGTRFSGHTPNSKTIELYENAFTSSEELVRTLAHERAHIWDLRKHRVNRFTDVTDVIHSEKLARKYETYVWNTVKKLFIK